MKQSGLLYHPWLLTLALALSLLMRLEHRYFFPNIYLDTEVQMAAGHNWMEGDGFGYRYTEGPDLADVQFRSGHIFMPGYAVILAFLQAWTQSWWKAIFFIDVLSFLLMYLGLLWMWQELKGDRMMLLCLFFILGISPAPLHYLTGSGALAIGLFSLSWAASLTFWRTRSLYCYIFCLLLACLAASVRSAYLPLTLAAPCIIGMWGIIRRDFFWTKWGIAGGAAMLLILLGIQSLKAGDESFFDLASQRIYWEHVLEMEPFPFKTFFYYGLPHELWLKDQSPSIFYAFQFVAYSGSFLVLAFLGLLSFRAWTVPDIEKDIGGFWLLSVWVVMGMNVAILVLMSLKIPPEAWNWGGFWTFVMEPRYYLPAMWGILISICWARTILVKKEWKQGLRLFVAFLMFVACTYPLFLKFRIHIQGNKEGTFAEDPRQEWISKIQEQLPDSHFSLVLTSSNNSHLGEMVDATTLSWDSYLQHDSLYASKPVRLMGLTSPEETPANVDTLEMINGYWWWEKRYSPD